MHEDGHDRVKCGLRPVVGGQIDLLQRQGNATLLRQPARLRDSGGGYVGCGNVQALLGQIDPIAPFPIGHRQHPPALRQTARFTAHKCIGLGSKDIVFRSEATVPECG